MCWFLSFCPENFEMQGLNAIKVWKWRKFGFYRLNLFKLFVNQLQSVRQKDKVWQFLDRSFTRVWIQVIFDLFEFPSFTQIWRALLYQFQMRIVFSSMMWGLQQKLLMLSFFFLKGSGCIEVDISKLKCPKSFEVILGKYFMVIGVLEYKQQFRINAHKVVDLSNEKDNNYSMSNLETLWMLEVVRSTHYFLNEIKPKVETW